MNTKPAVPALAATMVSMLVYAWTTTLSAIDTPAPQPVDGKVAWVYDYDEGKQLSRASGKPMFVVFRCER